MMHQFKKLLGIIRREVFQYVPAWFHTDFEKLQAQSTKSEVRFVLDEQDFYPCLQDRTTTTPLDRHYLYHPAWAGRVLARTKPSKHIDISSTLHFSTLLSAFVETEFYDYRPAPIELDHFYSGKADLTHLFFDNDSVASLSCMHTVEHIGLGRYGDPIDYDGDLKAMHELARVLKPGGCLLFVTPIGKTARIQFNAHRIYTASVIADTFRKAGLQLVEFAYIPEKTGGLLYTDPNELTTQDNYGCGCFWFTK
jgi:SAM-dependent methyltransferase